MQYEAAIRYLYGLEQRGMSPGLLHMRQVLAQRGSPERGFESVHVAGTNGKGSVAAMIASVLSQGGWRVGLFTSPHLHRLVERFRIGGRSMPRGELSRRVHELRPWLDKKSTPALSFFEVCTLLAFEWFRDKHCDVVVLEVGLGGRLDSTNVVQPKLSVITRIGLDHTDRLGPSLRHIAREKAGIIKAGVPVVAGVREPEALAVIRARARRLGASLLRIDREFSVAARGAAYDVRVGEALLRGLRLPLVGSYQADNLGCAVAGLQVLAQEGFAVDDAALQKGLARVRWPGRLELIPGPPDVLCDAAHNPDACAELAKYLDGLAGVYARKVLIFGVLRDKDHASMLELLLPRVDAVVYVTPASPRATLASALGARFGGTTIDDPGGALRYARKRAGKRGLIVAAGSIISMSAVRAQVLGLHEDPKIAM